MLKKAHHKSNNEGENEDGRSFSEGKCMGGGCDDQGVREKCGEGRITVW